MSEATGVVGSAQVAPSIPSSPNKGERSGGPTKTTLAITANDSDNGQRSATLVPTLTISLIDHDDNVPLRLGGGNGDKNDDGNPVECDMDIDSEIQTGITNDRKRFKSKSPGVAAHTSQAIETALNNVDTTLSNMRSYLADMTAATKIGKKWASGMEDFLTEVLINTKRIAIDAVEVLGANKQIMTELQKSKRQIDDLNMRIGVLSVKSQEDNQSRITRDPSSHSNKSYGRCLNTKDSTSIGTTSKGNDKVRK